NAFAVTANYFDVLGVRPVAGRAFDPDDDRTGARRTQAVLSYGFAQRLFGSDRAAVGRTVNLNSMAYDVIGVAPPDFRGTFTAGTVDVAWIPLAMHSLIFNGPAERLINQRRFRLLNVLGRLKPGTGEP